MDNSSQPGYHSSPVSWPCRRQLPNAPAVTYSSDSFGGNYHHHFGSTTSINSYAGPSSHHLGDASGHVQAIPAPQLKAAYEAPVFRTFQDRKREKELAWAASNTASIPLRYNPPPISVMNHETTYQHTHSDRPAIPATALAMMAQPGETGRPPPLPPTRASSTLSSASQTPPTSIPSPLPAIMPINSSVEHTVSPISISQASLDRSDTMSSIKSLDRTSFSSGRRPLPQRPVGVSSTRSLDRGPQLFANSTDSIRTRREQPSTVSEEDEATSTGSQSPFVTTPSMSTPPAPPLIAVETSDASEGWRASEIQLGSTTYPARAPNIPVISFEAEQKPPAQIPTLPTFNFPDDDDADDKASVGPQIAVSAAPPTISVTTSDHNPSPHLAINGAIICGGCSLPIIGRIVNAMGSRFHPQCFGCNECGELLEHVSSFEWEGKAYCHLDYHDRFAPRCHHCKTPIVDSQFVTLNDPVAGERHYHELHFFCSECGDPFLDPSKSSAPGTERSKKEDENQTNPFTFHRGHPYCENCHARLFLPKCKGCRKPIPGQAIKAMNANWHKACFKCSACDAVIVNNIFFPKDNHALCMSCFEKNF